jgi:hypothetical protein
MSGRNNMAVVAINRVDALHGAVVTAGNTLAGLPPSNLQDRQITKVARLNTVVAANTWWQVDFSLARMIDVVALVSHNLTQTGKWRVRLSNASDMSSPLYDSGTVDAWPAVGGFGSLPWGVFSWGDDIAAYELAFYNASSFAVLPSRLSARYLRVDLTDTTNAAGYLQAGRLVAGPAWFPSLNMLYGWSIQMVDESSADRSLGGQVYVDEKPRYRLIRFQLASIPESEAIAQGFDFLHRRKGVAGDVLLIPQPGRPDLFLHEAVYGRMRTLSPVVNQTPFVRSLEFEIEESL